MATDNLKKEMSFMFSKGTLVYKATDYKLGDIADKKNKSPISIHSTFDFRLESTFFLSLLFLFLTKMMKNIWP